MDALDKIATYLRVIEKAETLDVAKREATLALRLAEAEQKRLQRWRKDE